MLEIEVNNEGTYTLCRPVGELDAYMTELLRTRVLLAASDSGGLETLFAAARARRDAWLDGLKP